jgi:RND superfamily putative drug exporter
MKESRNIAARMGRWSAQHRKIAIFGWLAFVVAAFVIGGQIGTKELTGAELGVGESGRMMKLLDKEFPEPAGERVLVQSPTVDARKPEFKAAVADVVKRLDARKDVINIRSPLVEENFNLISRDGHSAIVDFQIAGDVDLAPDKVQPILDSVAAAQAAHPAFVVEQFGDASVEKEFEETFVKDLEKAGIMSVPLTLIILIVAFGALVAAGIPVLLALSAVIATLGLIAIPSQFMPVDVQGVGAVVLLIGLAVGVDYTMFYLKREREERAAGNDADSALQAAAATSGRSVLISGVTVIIAMAGMFFTGDRTFMGMAMGTILVVAVAVLGSLTVLPALLSKLGDNVERLRVPLIGRLQKKDGEGRVWSAILGPVLRYPVVSALLAAGFLVALGAFTLQMRLAEPGPEAFPQDMAVMQTYNKMNEAFPGGQIPAQVVVQAENIRAAEVREAIGQIGWRAIDSGVMHEPILVDYDKDRTVATISIPVDGTGTDAKSKQAVSALRDEILPNTVGLVDSVEEYGVAGMTAESMDFNTQMKYALPIVFAFVLGFAFLLMLLTFRSIVIAIKAIVMNLLSVAAAYGVLVLVFQHGYGKNLLDFDYTGGVQSFLPVFLFVILFGLSMDYHVFILSRIREGYDKGLATADAIAHGIKVTAGTVTSAAIVMVGVFAIFGTLPVIFLKQFGVGLAVAVLIDATIVRAVLLPATMKLLGEWNWYLPAWLEWLPKLEHEKTPEAPPVLAP